MSWGASHDLDKNRLQLENIQIHLCQLGWFHVCFTRTPSDEDEALLGF